MNDVSERDKLADAPELKAAGSYCVPTLTVDECLTECGIGPLQKQLLCVCCLAIAGDAMEKASLMYVLRAASQAWGVAAHELGYLGSVSALGQTLGYGGFGYLCDRIGRRASLLWCVSMTFVVGFACAFVSGFWPFLVGRLVINIALGGSMPVAFTLVSDYAPPCQRPRWASFLYASYGLGRLLSSLLASILLESSWRSFMLVLCLPSAIVLMLHSKIPESPQYLVAVGRHDEAAAALATLAKSNDAPKLFRQLSEGARIQVNSSAQECCTVHASVCSPQFQLFCVMWAMLNLGSQWFDWVLKILLDSGVPSDTVYFGLIFFNSNELVMPLAIACIPTAYLLERSRHAVMAASILAFSSTFAFGAIVSIGPMVVGQNITLAVAVCAAYLTISLWVLHYIITPSYFAEHCRATALGLCLSVNRSVGIVAPLFVSSVVEEHKSMVPYVSSFCLLAIGCLASCLGSPPQSPGEHESSQL